VVAAVVDVLSEPAQESTAAGGVNVSGQAIAFRDAATGRELARTERLSGGWAWASPGELALQFSADGLTLLAPTGSGRVLYDAVSGRQLRTFGLVKGSPRGGALSPDGRTVAVADGDGHLYEADTGRERLRLARVEGSTFHEIYDLYFSPDGTKVATISSGPGISTWNSQAPAACLWDARDGHRLAELKYSEQTHGGPVYGVDFSPDGHRLATASGDHTARIWDVATGHERIVLRGHGASVGSVAFAPDGRRVLTASDDGTARIWDTASGLELARLEGHDGPVRRAVLNAEGKVILTYGDDRTARLWDGADGRPICVLIRHDVGIRSAGFSPDGRTVFVSFQGQPALTRTWPVDFLAIARAQRPRELTPEERARFELPAP
jgi:WD40 repeat protein